MNGEATFEILRWDSFPTEDLDRVWLFADGTAVVDEDGYEDKGNLGALPRRFERPTPRELAECDVADPAEELYACLTWWKDVVVPPHLR